MKNSKLILLPVILSILLSGCLFEFNKEETQQDNTVKQEDEEIEEEKEEEQDEIKQDSDLDETKPEALIDPSTSEIITADNSKWATYRNNLYEFKFPHDLLTISENDDKLYLYHQVLYRHQDLCDFRDNPKMKDYIEDFKMRVTVYNYSLERSIRIEKDDYLLIDNFKNGSLVTSDGFIDPVYTSLLSGYSVHSTAEGCGIWKYYFPISNVLTLVIERDMGDLRTMSTSTANMKTQPGIILPEEEEEIFQSILESFKMRVTTK